ncbi:hypothetical protein HPB51_010579 [Rhipicephalus microplus]|uniref:Uncharacterized protein n=1 Tax=Rhipicephalus microplus TaxID=6941 RepID=A0A9J6E988_RHIMP|nr:hypothetical protein HPB51_010579 [Rhipicephalus microplus]
MAGMAWTLHPALFYEKYGTVLVQLWESGDVSTLFNPMRRLSRSIGDRITSLRRPLGTSATAAPKAGTVSGAAEAPGLMDDASSATVDVTEDDAMSRVNREPGDTSSEPSTSQQNELAFQGDIYTQMRRNRRQRERLQKIRETREKFLEGGSTSSAGSEFGKKRRGFQQHGSSILVSKKNKSVKKASGGGTPLTDMEGVVPLRAVVIDVSSSPVVSSSSEDEGVQDKIDEKYGATIQVEDLLEENDSLQAFRDVHGESKRSHGTPPPTVRAPSESQTDTESVASTSAAGQAPVASSPPLKELAQPCGAAKPPGHSALHKHKASRKRGTAVSRGKLATEPEIHPSVASIDKSSAVVPGSVGSVTEADFSSVTSSTKELVANVKDPESQGEVKSVAKKDASKRSKGAINEDAKPRRKHKKVKSPPKASASSLVPDSNESPTSTSVTMTPQVPEAVRRKDGTREVSMSTTSISVPEQRIASQLEDRIAEGKPSASTQAEAASSNEALGPSGAASRRDIGVHKRRVKKHRASKSPASVDVDAPSGTTLTSTKEVELKSPRPASTESDERVFDKAGALHDQHRHHHRRHSKSKKHAREGDSKRRSRKDKKDRTDDVTRAELLPATTTDADDGPSKVESSATTALK